MQFNKTTLLVYQQLQLMETELSFYRNESALSTQKRQTMLTAYSSKKERLDNVQRNISRFSSFMSIGISLVLSACFTYKLAAVGINKKNIHNLESIMNIPSSISGFSKMTTGLSGILQGGSKFFQALVEQDMQYIEKASMLQQENDLLMSSHEDLLLNFCKIFSKMQQNQLRIIQKLLGEIS